MFLTVSLFWRETVVFLWLDKEYVAGPVLQVRFVLFAVFLKRHSKGGKEMEYKQTELKKGIKLHTINTDKFKTNLIAVFITTKLTRSNSEFSLMSLNINGLNSPIKKT